MTDPRGPVAILGGTFDPVHLGHLGVAEAVMRRLGASRLVLMPAGKPPHKPAAELTAADHREAMLRLAVEGRPGLEVSTLEVASPGVCFTLDTMRRLRELDPRAQPVFVLGMDSLVELHTWHEFERLVEEFDLAVVDRPDSPIDRVRDRLHPVVRDRLYVPADPDAVLLDQLPDLGSGGRIVYIEMPQIDVSSSRARACAAAGEPLDELVPPTVARYIQRNELYREGGSALATELPAEVARCVEAALGRKAHDLVVLDLRGLSDVTDYFVICHGTSDRQALAITDAVDEALRASFKLRPSHVEGRQRGDWVLMDYIDFVVHVFLEDRRSFYRIERLWGDAPSIDVSSLDAPDEGAAPRPSLGS
ncbi:MAG: nicotinate (nicotinamide) nucleotide adenylyltransferase [bacterium]|nr:nicotinate (nicotinamide) nucleotide adenylyltransferase [bacterium]